MKLTDRQIMLTFMSHLIGAEMGAYPTIRQLYDVAARVVQGYERDYGTETAEQAAFVVEGYIHWWEKELPARKVMGVLRQRNYIPPGETWRWN